MNSCIYRHKAVHLVTALLYGALLLCACRTSFVTKSNHEPDQDSAIMTIFGDMVVGGDKSGNLIRFVELPPEQIQLLRNRCGGRYVILSIEMAQHTNNMVCLKESSKIGVIIRVKMETFGT